jgi:hypothetical protein
LAHDTCKFRARTARRLAASKKISAELLLVPPIPAKQMKVGFFACLRAYRCGIGGYKDFGIVQLAQFGS